MTTFADVKIGDTFTLPGRTVVYITPRQTEVRETAHADGTHAVVVGRYRTCTVRPDGDRYLRITQNGSRHGRRYHVHFSYQDAIDAAFAWGNRKMSR
jgi:hypothetical protein